MTRRIVTALAGLGVFALAGAAPSAAFDPPAREAAGFGRSVAIAGDYAFVGEPGGRGSAEGSVWVFRRGLPRTWQHSGTLTLPTGSEGFGTALAAEGNTLLVGHVPARAFQRPGGPAPEPEAPGMVHVYTRGANGSYAAAGMLAAPTTAGYGEKILTPTWPPKRPTPRPKRPPTATAGNGSTAQQNRPAIHPTPTTTPLNARPQADQAAAAPPALAGLHLELSPGPDTTPGPDKRPRGNINL